MNKNNQSGKRNRKHQQGAALMIALLAAVIVMLAATLLISLTERMVNGHQKRIVNAQISFSESSAADGLAFLLETEGAGVVSGTQSFELAGVTTEFTLTETGSSGIRRGYYAFDNPAGTVMVTGGNRLITASRSGDGTVMVVFYSDETFQPIAEFSLETSMFPAAGTHLITDQGNGAVFVLRGNGETALWAVTEQGVTASSTVGSVYMPSGCHLSAALSENGIPSLIATTGANHGALYNVASGQACHISSPVGTCPVFMADGTVFGTLSGTTSSFGISLIRDVFSGDFNNDGVSDMAFATSYSLSGVSGATGEIHSSAPGGSLVCWGEAQGRNGLVGMWKTPDGSEKWYRLGWDGFTLFTPENTYRMGWQGRFTALGNTFAGFLGSQAVVASSSGYLEELFSDGAFTGNSDGGDLDFFRLDQFGLEVLFNPVSGDGTELAFEAVNTFRGETARGGQHVFTLYETEDGTRVFHSLEGVDR